MSRKIENRTTWVSQWLSPRVALGWYRRLVMGVLLYSLLVILFSIASLLFLVGRPYGGFLWSWDNTHGIFRVDSFSLRESGALQPADFILGVDGQAGDPVAVYHRAHAAYAGATTVCTVEPGAEAPTLRYRVVRRGEELDVEAPIRCFRFVTFLEMGTIPFLLALLIWMLGVLVYRADSTQELNLVFAFAAALAANIVAQQGANIPPLNTPVGQTLALAVTNPSPIILPAVLYHFITIFPAHHPSRRLYRLRWIWYGLIPTTLIALGTLRFRLGADWHPWVGILDNVAGWGCGIFLYSGAVVLVARYLWIYVTTSSRQAKHQVKLIGLSALVALLGIPFQVAVQEPHLVEWIPLSPFTLLFWLIFIFIGLAFATLRYQVFPGRVRSLNVLVALAVAVAGALVFSPLLGLGFVALLATSIAVSLFWTLPNPLRRAVRRLTSPGTIERREIEAFNEDIQGMLDLDVLPLQILQSLERHLELHFAALWLEREEGILTLETFTDEAPAGDLPEELPTEAIWREGPARFEEDVLAQAGFEIALPLVAGDRRVGLIGIGPRWTEEVFDETDLVALGVIADQAALTLSTAQQIRSLRLVPLEVERAQLAERDRIAQDLHDSTQAQLAQLAFALERVRGALYTDPAQAEVLLDGCVEDVNGAAQELRAILRDLVPERLLGRDLISALRELVEGAGRVHGRVRIDLEADAAIETLLSEEGKIALLRICQQALSNALTHARAGTIRLILQPGHDRDVVEFSIIDDGRGFIRRPVRDFIERGHHGLHIMESRALQQRGHLEVEATPGRGTVVKGYLPAQG